MNRERKTELGRHLKLALRRIAALLVAISLLTVSVVYATDGEYVFTEQNIDQTLEDTNPDYSTSNNEDGPYTSSDDDEEEEDYDSEPGYEPGEEYKPDENPDYPDCDDDYIPDNDSDLEEKDEEDEKDEKDEEDEDDEDDEDDEELLELSVQASAGIVQFSAVTVTDQLELENAITNNATEIILDNPITITGTVIIPAGIVITAESGGFIVASGAELTLNSVLQAGNENGTGIVVNGTLNMNDGAVVSDFMHRGVIVNPNGVFTMNGGTIIGNNGANQWGTPADGAGVLVNGGTFIMDNGTITENTATSGAGVSVDNGGSFTMTGGNITNNTGGPAGTWGGGVDVRGANAEFVMEDGIIAGNSSVNGGGVNVRDGAEFTMTGGTIGPDNTASFGGGVRVIDATFTLDGGEITDNIATSSGGGVSILGQHSEVIMASGAVSDNNANGQAGGIHFIDGEFTLTGGTISGNTAQGDTGGGIRLGTQARFTMLGGYIVSNNAATRGGGIYGWNLDQDVNILGGVIEDNEANIGGGIFLSQLNDIDVNINGVEIIRNRADNGAGIGIWGTLGDGADITISAEIIGNIATGHGGGISIVGDNSEITIIGSIIEGNTAGGNGGGIALQTPEIVLNISDSEILNNTATNGGGIGFNIAGNDVDLFIAFLENVTIDSDVVFRGNLATALSRPNAYLYGYKIGIIPDIATHYGYLVGGFTNHDIHTPPVPRLTKTANSTTVNIGNEITYTITVTNPYPNISFVDFLIVDELNLMLVELVGDVDVNVSAGVDVVTPPDVTDGVITVEVTYLPAEGEIVIIFTVLARATSAGSVVNNTAFLDIDRKGPIEAYVDVQVRPVGGSIVDTPRPPHDPGPYRWNNIIPVAPTVTPPYVTVEADLTEIPVVFGYQEAVTPPVDVAVEIPVVVAVQGYQGDDNVEVIEARANPQTGDGINVLGLVISAVGLLVSAVAVIFIRRKLAGAKNA